MEEREMKGWNDEARDGTIEDKRWKDGKIRHARRKE